MRKQAPHPNLTSAASASFAVVTENAAEQLAPVVQAGHIENLHIDNITQIGTQITYSAAPSSSFNTSAKSELTKVYNIPPINTHFDSSIRNDLLKQLTEKLQPQHTAAQTIILAGLGGVGKTELARYFVTHTTHAYSLRIWLSADTSERLQSEYHALAQALKLIDPQTDKKIAQHKLFDWLANTQPGWLLIIDNADDVQAIQPLLPTYGGTLLITSRQSTDWEGKVLSLEVLQLSEASKLYRHLTQRDEKLVGEDHVIVEKLMKTLDYLPLAIAQAAAYVKKGKINTEQYYSRLSTVAYHEPLLSINKLTANNEEEKQRLIIASTWNLSLKTIEQRAHDEQKIPYYLARLVLTACAYLNAENIPRSLLEKWLALLLPNEKNQLLVDEAIDQLSSHSLIKVDIDSQMLHIHRLVQDVMRMQDQRDNMIMPESMKYPVVLKSLMDVLVDVFDYHPLMSRQHVKNNVQNLIAHVNHIIEQIKSPPLLQGKNYIKLLMQYSLYCSNELFDQNYALNALHTALLLPDCDASLKKYIFHQIGNLYFDKTDYSMASDFYHQSLEITLAQDYHALEGITWHQIANTISRSVEAQWDTITPYQLTTSLQTAEDGYRKAMILNAHYGNHLSIADSCHELANILSLCNIHDRARELIEMTVKKKQMLLEDENHPHLANSIEMWGTILFRQGNYFEAHQKYKQALDIYLKNYSLEHAFIKQLMAFNDFFDNLLAHKEVSTKKQKHTDKEVNEKLQSEFIQNAENVLKLIKNLNIPPTKIRYFKTLIPRSNSDAATKLTIHYKAVLVESNPENYYIALNSVNKNETELELKTLMKPPLGSALTSNFDNFSDFKLKHMFPARGTRKANATYIDSTHSHTFPVISYNFNFVIFDTIGFDEPVYEDKNYADIIMGYADSWIIEEYDLCLMSELPENNPKKAENGKLYLSNDGKYIARDPSGKVHESSLPSEANIDLSDLPKRLNDSTLKRAIFSVTSKRGHTLIEKLPNQKQQAKPNPPEKIKEKNNQLIPGGGKS